ncbi:MAG: hypothetical protein E7G60_05515 [Pantoea sp.]|nr:hypothetical protein [Pantoea sp.]
MFGALITADDGTSFITDESTPISLQGVYTKEGSSKVTQTITVNSEDVVLPFCVSTWNTFFSYNITGQTLTVNAFATSGDSSVFSFTCYVFTTRAQPIPKWGVAIWDTKGKCILTNETKVLTDIITVGQRGGANSGLNINQTLPGKIAILPDIAGFWVGVYMQRPIQIGLAMGARFDGKNTTIAPVTSSAPPSGAQMGAPLDSKVSVRAIDVSRYE